MEIRMDSQQGTKVTGIDEVVARIQQRLQADPHEWLKVLQKNPSDLVNLEQAIHRDFSRMADEVLAGLLAEATAPAAFTDAAKKK
jgi:hypothetical protein